MRALIPYNDNRPSVPAIPPCDFDAAFSRAIASPDVAPRFEYRPTTGTRLRRFARCAFTRLLHFLTELRQPPMAILRYLWRCYTYACVVLASILLAICLAIAIAKTIRTTPPPPMSAPGCPAAHSPSNTMTAPTGRYQF